MLLAVTLLVSLIAVSQGICPPAEWIAPHCTCWNNYGDAIMTCSNMYNPDDLTKPLQMIAKNRYHIFSMQIHNSSLRYIPHNAFKGVNIEKIGFFKSEIMSLSDTDTAFEGLEDKLEELRATEANYMTEWDWQQLRRMRNLQLIDINMINIGSVDQVFPPLKNLKALGITKTGVTHIENHAFEKLSGLKLLILKDNSIREVTRSMLPNPANELVSLDLSNNEISTIPKDFFQNMPHLSTVSLNDNRLTVLPEDTYKWPVENLYELLLGGNKFICDCKMSWAVAAPRLPFEFTATCAEPRSLAGKRVRDLDFKNFRC